MTRKVSRLSFRRTQVPPARLPMIIEGRLGTYLGRSSSPFVRSELRSDDDDNVKASDDRCDVNVQSTESLKLRSFVEILVKADF